jgi:hypothetical protein
MKKDQSQKQKVATELKRVPNGIAASINGTEFLRLLYDADNLTQALFESHLAEWPITKEIIQNRINYEKEKGKIISEREAKVLCEHDTLKISAAGATDTIKYLPSLFGEFINLLLTAAHFNARRAIDENSRRKVEPFPSERLNDFFEDWIPRLREIFNVRRPGNLATIDWEIKRPHLLAKHIELKKQWKRLHGIYLKLMDSDNWKVEIKQIAPTASDDLINLLPHWTADDIALEEAARECGAMVFEFERSTLRQKLKEARSQGRKKR